MLRKERLSLKAAGNLVAFVVLFGLTATCAYALILMSTDNANLKSWAAAIAVTSGVCSSLLVRRKFRPTVIISIFSLGLSLALFELFLQVSAESETLAREKSIVRLTTSEDIRSSAKVKEDLLASGVEVTPRVGIPTADYSDLSKESAEGGLVPLGGVSYSNTLLCNEWGYWVLFESDRYGFRNTDSSWDKVGAFLVGDSYVLGECVRSHSTLGSVVQQNDSLSRRWVSLGIGGAGPIQRLALLREYVSPMAAELVVWVHTEGTMNRGAREFAHRGLSRYLTDDGYFQNLRQKQFEIDVLWNSWLRSQLQTAAAAKEGGERGPDGSASPPGLKNLFSRVKDVLKLPKTRQVLSSSPYFPPSWLQTREWRSVTRDALNQAARLADKGGFQLVVAYVPTSVDSGELNWVKQAAADLGVCFIDTTESFLSAGHVLPSDTGLHPQAAQYAAMGKEIAEGLKICESSWTK